jgi:hypothetical protein
MAIIKVGLKRASKSSGNNPRGSKIFLVGSSTKVGDDIDQILDASQFGGTAIPAYDALWDASDALNLRVDTKDAEPWDEEGGTQEGYWWQVIVQYLVPDVIETQRPVNPTDRDWEWSKTTDKQERVIFNSLFDTTGYVYPQPVGVGMLNLEAGDAITNTAGDPPEGGVTGPVSRSVITLTKYVNDASDLGVADWETLDTFIDSVNDGSKSILDVDYLRWDLLMDDISYAPHSENGYECFKVVFRVIADKYIRHVFSYPSAGYNQIIDGTSTKILVNGEEPSNPVLLDLIGQVIPDATASPYIKIPVIVSAGVNQEKDWSSIALPATIP